MSEQRLLRLREILGWVAAACCLCAALGLADSFVNSFRSGPNAITVVIGGEAGLSGPLPAAQADASTLVATIDQPGLSFVLAPQPQGFWMRSHMWQGVLTVAPEAKPGKASMTLRPTSDPGSAPIQTFVIQVYPDQAALNAASHSNFIRLLGLSPMAAAAYALLFAVATGLGVGLTNRRLRAIWTATGRAAVYMAKKTPDGLLISFGLGTDQGLVVGAPVAVHDLSGRPTAMATAVRCSPTESVALVVGDGAAALGHLVRLAKASDQPAASL